MNSHERHLGYSTEDRPLTLLFFLNINFRDLDLGFELGFDLDDDELEVDIDGE
jgi:hypothetical protein